MTVHAIHAEVFQPDFCLPPAMQHSTVPRSQLIALQAFIVL